MTSAKYYSDYRCQYKEIEYNHISNVCNDNSIV